MEADRIKALRALCAERKPGSWELAFSVAMDIVPELLDEIERLQEERDAAVKDMEKTMARVEDSYICLICERYVKNTCRYVPNTCSEQNKCNPKWRGLCADNAPSGAESEAE